MIYDVRASWAVPEAIEQAGGVPLINRVGHAFIKQRMREVDAVFGGEVSAHYYFRDFSQADSGTVPFLLMCELVLEARMLSEVLAAVPQPLLHHRRDQHAGRRRAREARGARGAVRRRRAGVTHLDGLSVEFDDWHFNVRPSNTEPLLRLNLEARSQELMDAKRDEVLAVIRA